MMDKILIFGWLALAAILIVENVVMSSNAFVFLDSSSKWWILSIVSLIIWFLIWYWFKWFLNRDASDSENYDF